VRAGRDVNQVALVLDVEGIVACELVQRAVDLLEIPRVARIAQVQVDLRLRRDGTDVVAQLLGELRVRPRVQQLEAVDDQFLVLADR
jgi:hypothetical protein